MLASREEKKIRVIVGDDSRAMRAKILELLGSGYEVVGTAADGSTALELILQLGPDVAILDVSMPILNGIEVAAESRSKGSSTKIVILTVYEDPDYMRASLKAGASAFVKKPDLARDLKVALNAAREGRHFISPNCPANSGMSVYDRPRSC